MISVNRTSAIIAAICNGVSRIGGRPGAGSTWSPPKEEVPGSTWSPPKEEVPGSTWSPPKEEVPGSTCGSPAALAPESVSPDGPWLPALSPSGSSRFSVLSSLTSSRSIPQLAARIWRFFDHSATPAHGAGAGPCRSSYCFGNCNSNPPPLGQPWAAHASTRPCARGHSNVFHLSLATNHSHPISSRPNVSSFDNQYPHAPLAHELAPPPSLSELCVLCVNGLSTPPRTRPNRPLAIPYFSLVRTLSHVPPRSGMA